MTEQIVAYDSAEAASIQTATGWVSRTGIFCGNDEHMARYEGCTHRPCGKCGELISTHSYCRDCHAKEQQEKYEAMPRADWNGADMLYSEAHHVWIQDADYLADYCDEHACTTKELCLIIGVPCYASEIDALEHYSDDLPEDGDLPADVEEAFAKLNEALRASKSILSWQPGKFATTDDSVSIVEAKL